jgi:hypothetical protein
VGEKKLGGGGAKKHLGGKKYEFLGIKKTIRGYQKTDPF